MRMRGQGCGAGTERRDGEASQCLGWVSRCRTPQSPWTYPRSSMRTGLLPRVGWRPRVESALLVALLGLLLSLAMLSPPQQTMKLETVEELLDIDELIKTQPSKKDLLTARLSKIGYDLKSCLSTIMDRLMTNELTSNLNMKGGGGKTAFAETKLLDVVTELVSWIPRRGPKRWSMMPLKIN
ncbi:uncharacterized protein LOC133568393 isoform X2 [Nerophis ophidion]|uniref:uncharacterized protein LOC133568393 isoform X2 n=1 Tax=Nerophis ophidion TaxID=159077 RepID=UPI002AE094D3|nr:uncharacterized protein LOC133568393 isoform X2 [Nerophis ophidion]